MERENRERRRDKTTSKSIPSLYAHLFKKELGTRNSCFQFVLYVFIMPKKPLFEASHPDMFLQFFFKIKIKTRKKTMPNEAIIFLL